MDLGTPDALDALDAGATLQVAAAALRATRAAEAQVLLAAAHWADLHPGREGVRHDGWLERSVQLGGEGTPEVMEFCPAELAIVLQIHPLGCRAKMAEALDLRHRLPHLWALTVQELRVPAWVAGKVARMTRHLTKATAAVIDARIAGDTDDAATLAPSRLLDLVEGMVLAADNATADEERDKALGKRFVTISDHASDPGTTGIYGCLDEAGGQVLEDTITRLAKALKDAGDTDSVDLRRAKALVLMGTPALALQYLLGLGPAADTVTTDTDQPEDRDSEQPGRSAEPPWATKTTQTPTTDLPEGPQTAAGLAALAQVLATIDPAQLAPTVVLFLHLTDHTLFTQDHGVARFEGVGPITRNHLIDLLGHTNITVKPLLIPTEHRPADSYEYTGNLKEAVLALHPRDIYPYAVGATRNFDIDHTDPYHDTGPPDQTRVGNAGPMNRHHHRIKTHGPITVKQPTMGTYIWRTPHRHYRMTNNTGTHEISPKHGDTLYGPSTMEAHLTLTLINYSES
jgi:hypothetical protein